MHSLLRLIAYYFLTLHPICIFCASQVAALKLSSLSPPRKIVDQSTLTLLDHVNLNVPSHEYILPFYFDLLGFGLDPRKAGNLKVDAKKKTIWANCGANQFHLPYGEVSQRIPGHIGLRYDSLDGLKSRLQQAKNSHAAHQCFKSYEAGIDPRSQREYIKVVDMYDNVFFCKVGAPVHTDKRQPIISAAETEKWGEIATSYGREESECRGIEYVEFSCPKNAAEKIALFYEAVFDATTTYFEDGTTKIAIVAFGSIDEHGKAEQSLLFREVVAGDDGLPPYDGHHISIYVGESPKDFSQAFKNAELCGVVWVNPRFSDQATTLQKATQLSQFRFKNIIDMATGETIMELEHEVRSVLHSGWCGKKYAPIESAREEL